MSCAGKGYGTNPHSNDYLTSQFSSTLTNATASNIALQKSSRNCRRYQGFYPSFTPSLGGLSVNSSSQGIYTLVYVTGANFLPNGTTFIKFGNFGYLPATYYSSFNLSFIVPINALAGNYNVQVVNLYNGNFSPSVNQSYPGNLNFSNGINYTIN